MTKRELELKMIEESFKAPNAKEAIKVIEKYRKLLGLESLK